MKTGHRTTCFNILLPLPASYLLKTLGEKWLTSVGLVPSSHQMERAASPTTSVPAFQRIVTQGSSHRLWQMGYQHLCLLTTKQQKGCQAIPSPGYGRLAASSAHCCVPVSASAAAQDHHHPPPSPNSSGSSPASDYPLCSLLIGLFSKLSAEHVEDQSHSVPLP